MFHPFHLVSLSPWPFLLSTNLILLAVSIASLINGVFFSSYSFYLSLILASLTLSLWVRDVLREGTFMGDHVSLVSKGLYRGFLLFILSEVMVFFSLIWGTYFLALSPSIDLGCIWPPTGVHSFNPYTLPLLNTFILLSSGCSITWAHYALLSSSKVETSIGLLLTVFLGLVFSCGQFSEYSHASFSLSTSVWGSTFFLTTGLHGVHVIIGSLLLIFSLFRLSYNHFSVLSHLGFEVSILYWHFVDLVWLIVYSTYYLWV